MTDEERNGLLRWAAEEVLGWTKPWPWGWLDAAGHTYGTSSLKGWLGFGLAIEAAISRGLWAGMNRDTFPEYDVVFHDTEGHGVGGDSDADPGIAAWRALREALNA